MEEFVFRRSILGIVEKYTNFWVGAVISSLLFAFAHNDGHLLIYFFLGFSFIVQLGLGRRCSKLFLPCVLRICRT